MNSSFFMPQNSLPAPSLPEQSFSVANESCSDRKKQQKTVPHPLPQAFRFMIGPGHCPMILKYGPSLSKAVGQVDLSFLGVKKSHFNKNIHRTSSLQTSQNRKYM